MNFEELEEIRESSKYRRAEIQLAFDFCPEIIQCKKCGMPCVSGYCCTCCKDENPNEEGD